MAILYQRDLVDTILFFSQSVGKVDEADGKYFLMTYVLTEAIAPPTKAPDQPPLTAPDRSFRAICHLSLRDIRVVTTLSFPVERLAL